MRLIDAEWLEDLLLMHEQNARAIEASGRKVSFTYADGIRTGYADVGLCPTIEAEPITHGRWLIGVGENGEPIGTYCSECGWSWERNIAVIQLNKIFSRIETPRCPNCGADMRERREDE